MKEYKIILYRRILLLLSILLFFCGGMIYVLYREPTLRMFQWFDILGLSPTIQHLRNCNTVPIYYWMMTSLPDGLWMSAYLLSMKAIWLQEHSRTILLITLLLPIAVVLTEILQYYSLFPGYFDWYDILNYTIPVIIYLILYYYEQKN